MYAFSCLIIRFPVRGDNYTTTPHFRPVMDSLSEYSLLVIGRSVDYDGEAYYLSKSHYEMLVGMSEEFDSAIYLCQHRRTDDVNGLVEVDESRLEIRANTRWKRGSVHSRLRSLQSEIRAIRSLGHDAIAYIYYPGFYSFLLSPSAVRWNKFVIGHFGSDANDTANAAYSKSLTGLWKRNAYRVAQWYVMRSADLVLATDPKMKQAYETTANHIVESVPVTEFGSEDIEPIRSSSTGEPIWILFVGVFRPVKGLEYLVDAFASLRERCHRDVRLRLVGDGAVREDIERQIAAHGVSEWVELTGYVGSKKQLIEYYQNSDILAIPSLKESVPRVLYEAAAVGLPVVATTVGGIPVQLDHGEDALLVPPRNSEALAEAIAEIAGDEQFACQLATNLRETVKWHLEGDPVEQRLELLERMVSTTGKR